MTDYEQIMHELNAAVLHINVKIGQLSNNVARTTLKAAKKYAEQAGRAVEWAADYMEDKE